MRVATHIAVRDVRIENHDGAIGIDEAEPRLSFRVIAPDGWRQRSVDVELRHDDGAVDLVGPIAAEDGVYLTWPFRPLRHRAHATLRIRVRGADGSPSPWSDPLPIERGPAPEDWAARPVSSSAAEDPDSDRRPSLVRREFAVEHGLVRALLRITAHGLYEAELNGARIGRDELAPGWSVYGERLKYATHDLTAHLKPGANVLGVWLADGWYRGRIGFSGGNRNLYGSDLSLIAQLELRYADGREVVVATDDAWRAHDSPILFSGIYDGETHDAREELRGWSSPGFDDSGWLPVVVGERDPRSLVAPDGPPVRVVEELVPAAVTRLDARRLLVDFGQNLAGRVRFSAAGRAGTAVVLRHAEVLQGGELYTRPLRLARATDTYVFADDRRVEWEPRFTYHGFRYAEVSADPDVLDGIDLVARVLHSDMRRIGEFACSDERITRLHENVVWSMRGNFVDLPTDCPQRDERLGWTGDIQVFAPTASFLYDTTGMLSSWLKDLAVEQLPDGTVPWYVPVVPGRAMWTPIRPGAAWGDAAVLTPWDLWRASGDRALLQRQWPSARSWVDLMAGRRDADGLWTGDFQLGDWLDPSAPPDAPAEAMTDRDLVASAYLSWSSRILARTASELGMRAEAEHYGALADDVAAAIRARHLDADGRLVRESQTGYALLVCFELVDGRLRERAGERLRALVEAAGHRIATGFVGTPIISRALTETGSLDTAYRQLLEDTCPSWMYPLTQGATTVWERWDSQLEDGTVNPGQMTSFNHYALGAVAHWMHTTIAGLELRGEGWRSVRFAPRPGGGLTWARAAIESPRGRIAIAWERTGDDIEVTVDVPPGVAAEFAAPGAAPVAVPEGRSVLVFPAEETVA
ncbi:family 78 glycoside hydrolase catalytic domain [Microbacterium sp. NPDC055683]